MRESSSGEDSLASENMLESESGFLGLEGFDFDLDLLGYLLGGEGNLLVGREHSYHWGMLPSMSGFHCAGLFC